MEDNPRLALSLARAMLKLIILIKDRYVGDGMLINLQTIIDAYYIIFFLEASRFIFTINQTFILESLLNKLPFY